MSTITIGELRDLIEHEKLKPGMFYTPGEILLDPKVSEYIEKEKELAHYRAEKRKEEQKLKEEKNNPFIPN